MTESSAVGGAQNQGPEQNGAKPGDKPGEKPIHQWPDSLTLIELVGELATEEAAAEIEKEMDGFCFSPHMHHILRSQETPLQLAPGLTEAVSAAARAYHPSDGLYEFLDQEMRVLPQTAADTLPRDQWMRLRQAAKEDLQRHVQDGTAGALFPGGRGFPFPLGERPSGPCGRLRPPAPWPSWCSAPPRPGRRRGATFRPASA